MGKITTDSAKLPTPTQGIAVQKTSVGSGSRPTKSQKPIMTSMTGVDPTTLGRESPGGNDTLR